MIFRNSARTGAATATQKLSLKEVSKVERIERIDRMERFEFPLTKHPGEIQCWFDNSWKQKCKIKQDRYFWVGDAADSDDRKQASELFQKQMVNLAELSEPIKSLEAFGSDFEDAEFQRIMYEIQKTKTELDKLRQQSEKLTAEERNINQVLNELEDPSLTDKVFEEAKKKSYAAELMRTKVAVYERQIGSLSAKTVAALSGHREKEFENRKRIGDQMASRINARLEEDRKLIDEFIAYLPSLAEVAPSDRPLASTIQYPSNIFGPEPSRVLQALGLGRIVAKPGCYEFTMREDWKGSSEGSEAPVQVASAG